MQERTTKGGGTKNAATITLSEFMRIKGSINIPTAEDAEAKKQERKTMHETAMGKVKNWPNTLDTLRKKKEDDKVKKARDEEIRRREIDAREAAYQHELRRAAIEKSNQALYMQQDQVKAFNSKMLLADVLQEREAQLRLNGERKEVQKEIEQGYVEQEKAQMQAHDEGVKVKEATMQEKKDKNATAIREQWREAQIKRQKLAQEEKVEGELIKKQVAEELEKDYQKEAERRQRAVETQGEFLQANERLRKQKEEQKQKELTEEQKTLEYAREKDAMTTLRKQKEEERFKAKQAVRQKMIDKQVEVLRSIKSNEEQRLEKQVAEAQQKAQQEFEEKERKANEMKAAIEKSRLVQAEKKRLAEQRKKEDNEHFTADWKQRMDHLVKLVSQTVDTRRSGRKTRLSRTQPRPSRLSDETSEGQED
jgi:hypothetical protein